MTGRSALAWALLYVVTLVAVVEYQWLYLFSRELSLDEGYLMISVQGFLQGRPLYDEVFTQYGPFHYFVRALQHGAGLPLDHDHVRLATLLTWLGTAGLVALAVVRQTRSMFAGWLGFLASIALLSPLAHEPGHPQELVALLLAFLAVLVMSPRQTQVGWILIGGVATALALIKINVGVLAVLAVMSTVLMASVRGKIAGRMVMLALAIVPVLLMSRHLQAGWAVQLGLIVLGALLPSLLLQGGREGGMRVAVPLRSLLALGAGAFACGVMTIGLALLWGSTPDGLLRGLVTQPLALASLVVLPPEWPLWAPLNLVVAMIAWVLYARSASTGEPLRLAMAKAVFGSAVLLLAGSDGALRIAALAPWLWLGLVPVAKPGVVPGESYLARPLIVTLAAWQLLQIYPIAGSQLAVATLLLIPVGLLALWDALPVLRTQPRLSPVFAAPVILRVFGCVLILGLSVFAQLRIADVRAQYREAAPLVLPGSHWVRTNTAQAGWYQALSGFLPQQGDTFVSFPGVNSLYFWTGMQPPTAVNVTEWSLLDDGQIRQIVAALKATPRPLVVVVVPALEDWQAADQPVNALAEYVLEECSELGRIGPFVVFRGQGKVAAPGP